MDIKVHGGNNNTEHLRTTYAIQRRRRGRILGRNKRNVVNDKRKVCLILGTDNNGQVGKQGVKRGTWGIWGSRRIPRDRGELGKDINTNKINLFLSNQLNLREGNITIKVILNDV